MSKSDPITVSETSTMAGQTSHDDIQSDSKKTEYEMQDIRAPDAEFPLPKTADGDNSSAMAQDETDPEMVVVRSKFRVVAVMTALYSCLFITALNQTMVATATPTICAQLNSASGYSWVAGAYLLANGASVSIWAKLSDIWGRKPLLLVSSMGYLGASIFCALSKDMPMLIAGRALQGAAGGGLYQLVNITISDMFSLRKRALMLSLMEMIWIIAGGVGPVIGGALSQYVSWRWIFWINLPICSIAFLFLFFFLNVHNPRTKLRDGLKAVDWLGSLSILGLMVMVLLGLDFGGEVFAWNSPTVICLLIFGGLMSVIFIVAEKKIARFPVMPMDIYNHRSNIGCLLVAFMQDFVASSVEYYIPLFFQSVHGASPSRSGLLVIPLIITQSIVGMGAGVVMHRFGHFIWIIRIATILLTLGTGLLIYLKASSSLGTVIGFEIIFGLGCGALWGPPLVALQAFVPKAQMSTATATQGFARSVATSISIVISGVIFQDMMKKQYPALVASGLPSNITSLLGGGEAAAHVDLVSTITDPEQRFVVESAFANSLRYVWILCTCISSLAIVGGFMVARSELTHEHVETKTGIEQMKLNEKEAQEAAGSR